MWWVRSAYLIARRSIRGLVVILGKTRNATCAFHVSGASYSVPLIPDIALSVPDGPNAGLHLFDAKFRVRALTDVGLAADDKDADDEKTAERAGSFKRADIYKMHAYRDAISEARSVWILYPGGEYRFFGVRGVEGRDGGRVVSSAKGLPGRIEGVGAIPVAPLVGGEGDHGREMAAASGNALRATLGRMLRGGTGM